MINIRQQFQSKERSWTGGLLFWGHHLLVLIFTVVPYPLCGILSIIDDLVVVFLFDISMINISQQFWLEGKTMIQIAI